MCIRHQQQQMRKEKKQTQNKGIEEALFFFFFFIQEQRSSSFLFILTCSVFILHVAYLSVPSPLHSLCEFESSMCLRLFRTLPSKVDAPHECPVKCCLVYFLSPHHFVCAFGFVFCSRREIQQHKHSVVLFFFFFIAIREIPVSKNISFLSCCHARQLGTRL